MDDKQVALALVGMAKSLVAEGADTGTFKCPECGGKVLKQTEYCLSCKKKVKPAGEKKEAAKKYGSVREMVADIDAMVMTVVDWMQEYEDEGATHMPLYKQMEALYNYLTNDAGNKIRKFQKQID